ncbi:PIN domain-containing protein [Mesorhizobium sp. M0816]|uniref:PIN domain-containing protein n=1 Tax=Mesorhizobium sp. M0816 TaxID=2957006 RepID=UPI0033388D48
MIRVLVDTCVWLDLAKDYRQQTLIQAAKELFDAREIDFVVPDVIKEEFARNKERVVQDAQRSLQAHFRLVKEAVDRFAEDDYKKETLHSLNEVDQRIAMKGEAVNSSIAWIEGLLSAGLSKQTTKAIKQRVTERAVAGLAPYHRSKNSVGDAILVETYVDLAKAAKAKGQRVAFVTHNTKDFSDPNGDQRSPHPDIAALFDGPHSTYWTSLGDLLRAEHPGWLEFVDEEFAWTEEPRRLSELIEAARLLERQVWYNRHWGLRTRVERGDTKVVTKKQWEAAKPRDRNNGVIVDSIWEGALEAARKTEEEVGLENLGPWTDFEWGMVNGKLSAIRWVLGEDWDELYT